MTQKPRTKRWESAFAKAKKEHWGIPLKEARLENLIFFKPTQKGESEVPKITLSIKPENRREAIALVEKGYNLIYVPGTHTPKNDCLRSTPVVRKNAFLKHGKFETTFFGGNPEKKLTYLNSRFKNAQRREANQRRKPSQHNI